MARETTPLVSTGRGGVGNIGHDDTVYTDGSIIREGPEGSAAGPEEFSTGRGGAGNISASRSASVVSQMRVDEEIVPEVAVRHAYENYHTGRGGEGNVHKDKYGGHTHAQEHKHRGAEGLGEKVKGLFGKREGGGEPEERRGEVQKGEER